MSITYKKYHNKLLIDASKDKYSEEMNELNAIWNKKLNGWLLPNSSENKLKILIDKIEGNLMSESDSEAYESSDDENSDKKLIDILVDNDKKQPEEIVSEDDDDLPEELDDQSEYLDEDSDFESDDEVKMEQKEDNYSEHDTKSEHLENIIQQPENNETMSVSSIAETNVSTNTVKTNNTTQTEFSKISFKEKIRKEMEDKRINHALKKGHKPLHISTIQEEPNSHYKNFSRKPAEFRNMYVTADDLSDSELESEEDELPDYPTPRSPKYPHENYEDLIEQIKILNDRVNLLEKRLRKNTKV